MLIRKRRHGCYLAVAISLLGLTFAPFLGSHDAIGRSTYEKIRLGMTLQEVEEIIGRPGLCGSELATAGTLGRGVQEDVFLDDGYAAKAEKNVDASELRGWRGRHAILGVRLGPDERVVGKRFVAWRDKSFLERMRNWLGW